MGRKEYKKVYHGVPKSNTDEHTILYESMEIMPSGFTQLGHGIPIFKHGVVGVYPNYAYCFFSSKNIIDSSKPITVDLWENDSMSNERTLISIEDDNGNGLGFHKAGTTGKIYFTAYKNSVWKAETVVSDLQPTGTYHIRYVADILNKIGSVYINGKILGTVSLSNVCNTFDRFTGKFTKILLNGLKMSDIHISNIDRGDYFPNLPQDFIEGKAIIKPRMGQQQIKGDPMYSQVTTLKVPSSTGVEYPTLIDNNYYQHKYNPELSVKGANRWSDGSSFRIRGLNAEVISGVIDTDTALAKVTKSNLNMWNLTTITVDDVTKLSEGDTIILYVASNGYYTSEASIQSINTKTNEITLTSKLLSSEGGVWGVIDLSTDPDQYIFETTRDTSSPLVKTKDGTPVVGTWKGLGTPTATFTLGNNNGLQGKDLYVDYSLTMPLGNSDFKDIPQDIEYINNQNSVKLKETNKLTIEDDFMGKTKQYGDNCSSTVHFIPSNSLVDPTSSSLNSSNEISIGEYSNISLLNMNEYINRKSTKDQNLLQLICKFNLIDMVENKFSTELPGNKLEWIKSHISKFSFYVIGKGNTTIYLSPYNVDESKWFRSDSKYNGTNFSPILYVHSSGNKPSEDWINKSIDSNGNVYFRIYTDAVNPSTEFSIDIAYIKLEIELKYDTTFKLYFSENRRAREDKCVPMLVQKETKTIKSYLDIKEPIVTEYVYNKFNGVSPSVVPSFEEFEYSNNIQINSMGTGRAVTANNVNYKASIAYLTKRDTCKYTAEPVCNTAYEMYSDYATEHYASGTKYISRTNTYANRSYGILVDGRDVDANNFTTIFPFLINYNGSLHLGTITDFFINRKQSGQEIYYFPLPNTPLLK